jgi:hypothetical protein
VGNNEPEHQLVECTDDALWDSLVLSSREANPFLNSSFLSSIGKLKGRRLLYQESKPVLGTCLSLESDSASESESEFNIFQGAFFPGLNDSSYRDDNKRLNLISILAEKLDQLGDCGKYSFHPSIRDMRGLEWFYYGNKETKLAPLHRVRYTGEVRLKEFSGFDDYISTIRKSRIDELKKSQKLKHTIVHHSSEVDDFLHLYTKTFERQNLQNSSFHLKQVEKIISDMIRFGHGSLDLIYSNDGKPYSGVFIISDIKTDVYLFGATDPEQRNLYGSTHLILNAIRRSFKNSRHSFDFCGINSPMRGSYKSSFNSRVAPYFEIEFVSKDN